MCHFLQSQALHIVRTLGQAFEVCHKLQSQERQQRASEQATENGENEVAPSVTVTEASPSEGTAHIEPPSENQTDGTGTSEEHTTLGLFGGDEGTSSGMSGVSGIDKEDLIKLDIRHSILAPQPSEPLIRPLTHMSVSQQISTPLPLPERTPPGKRNETGLPSKPPNTNLLNLKLWSPADINLHQAASGRQQMVL